MKFTVLILFCVGLLRNAAGLKEDFERDVVVTEFEQQEKQTIDIVVSPDTIASLDIEIGDLSEPIQDVDVYVMVDVSDMSAWQRKKAANAVIKMVDDLRAVNASRQVRLALGTLVNRHIGSHHGNFRGRRTGKTRAQRLVQKADRMLKNCNGRKCHKWLKLKQHHGRFLTPIIHTSFRHQMNFTDDLSNLKETFADATRTGEAHVVSSQWEALLRASSCSEIGNFSTEAQRILFYINSDGTLEPKASNHKRRRSSDNSLKCSNGEPFVNWHKHEFNKHHANFKLSNRKVANSLMQARVRLVAAVPYSKKAFMTKRNLRSVPHVEVFPFSKSFVNFGEKAAVKIEEMLTAAPNGMIHNATWPLIVRNVATPCSKRQLKKAAKKNKPLKCGEGNPSGWNVTVEIKKCSRRKHMESPVYFEIWAYNYNTVIGVNTTVLCKDNGNSDDIAEQRGDKEASEIDTLNEDDDQDMPTEDPDEATEFPVELINGDADLEEEMPFTGETTDLPVTDEDEENHTPEPEAEVLYDSQAEAIQTAGCSEVRACVVCNFIGDKETELCGECKVKIQPIDKSEVESMESCQARLEDDCRIDYYIATVGRSSAAPFVLAELNCEDEDNEII